MTQYMKNTISDAEKLSVVPSNTQDLLADFWYHASLNQGWYEENHAPSEDNNAQGSQLVHLSSLIEPACHEALRDKTPPYGTLYVSEVILDFSAIRIFPFVIDISIVSAGQDNPQREDEAYKEFMQEYDAFFYSHPEAIEREEPPFLRIPARFMEYLSVEAKWDDEQLAQILNK